MAKSSFSRCFSVSFFCIIYFSVTFLIISPFFLFSNNSQSSNLSLFLLCFFNLCSLDCTFRFSYCNLRSQCLSWYLKSNLFSLFLDKLYKFRLEKRPEEWKTGSKIYEVRVGCDNNRLLKIYAKRDEEKKAKKRNDDEHRKLIIHRYKKRQK